jgi:glycosyltransferase 2 family protein
MLFWWIFSSIDLPALLERVENLSVIAALTGIAILIFQSFIAALRLRLFTEHMGDAINLSACWQYTLVGLFFNQALPSTVGGDGVKIWLLSQRPNWTLRLSLHCIILDRALGLLALLFLIVLSMPWIVSTITDTQAAAGIGALVFIGFFGCLIFALMPRLPLILERNRIISEIREFRGVFRSVFLDGPILCLAVIYGLAVHALNVAVLWFIAQDVGIAVSFSECLVIVPTVLLVSVVPISIAGWGLREGAMVAGFSYLGISAADAVFLSVTLGLGMTAVGLIGGLVWMLSKAKKAVPIIPKASSIHSEIHQDADKDNGD